MIEVTPKEKPIVGNVKDMPKTAEPQPTRKDKRKKKAIHSATTNTKSKFFFGAIAALGVIFAKTITDQAYRDASK